MQYTHYFTLKNFPIKRHKQKYFRRNVLIIKTENMASIQLNMRIVAMVENLAIVRAGIVIKLRKLMS